MEGVTQGTATVKLKTRQQVLLAGDLNREGKKVVEVQQDFETSRLRMSSALL